MKHRYITTQAMIVCLTNSNEMKKNIHTEINETIRERNLVLPGWEKMMEEEQNGNNDIHLQLRKTIADFKRSMKRFEKFFNLKKAA